jgi:hypothetical protein
MSIIFVIGPCWNNLKTLIDTININHSFLENIKINIKKIYITTNDKNVNDYFSNLNNEIIISQQFSENEGHQTSCFNAIISGMKMIIDYEDDNEDDIVIFSHEDCHINDIELFNHSINKIKNGYDIVCRLYNGSKNGNNDRDYYMNDVFLIKKNKIKEIFQNTSMKKIEIGNWCENEFTNIIKNYNIFHIPYYKHSSHKDSELGFYHILNYDIGDIPFWDKKNKEEILKL